MQLQEALIPSAAPSGQTCNEWAGRFATAVGGYLNNPDATGVDCEFCQYSVGDSFYRNLEIDYAVRWREFGIFVSDFSRHAVSIG